MNASVKKNTRQDLTRFEECVHAFNLINDLKKSLKQSKYLTITDLYMLELCINPICKQISAAYKLKAINNEQG